MLAGDVWMQKSLTCLESALVMAPFLKRDSSLLALSVIAALLTRLLVLVVGRPAFVGWFNHSPYYWVQAKSLLENGNLAYGDMPLVFALYAGLAKLCSLPGVPLDDAVILSSRLVMAAAPALIPIAIYIMAKKASGADRLDWPSRCLVFASGFLPLTFANMPEVLQKNMVGLVLLGFSVVALYGWLRERRTTHLLLLVGLLIAVCLAHLGSALAALLLVAAVFLDVTLRRSTPVEIARIALFSVITGLVIALGIRFFDPASWDRVAAMSAALLPSGAGEAALSILVIAIWFGLLLYAWRWLARRTADREEAARILTRVMLLWLGLLAMPLWPGDIGLRLLLFMPLGAVCLLALLLQMLEGRMLRALAAITTVVFCLMSVGEAMSVYMVYPNKDEIAKEMAEAADKYGLSQNDLVITPYGVTPVANWFLGTRASLVTAVERDMVSRFERVFVLNTLERPAPELASGDCRLVRSDDDRYRATRHDTPIGNEAERDPDFSTFALYLLGAFPEDWVFDDQGRWLGWGDCEEPS